MNGKGKCSLLKSIRCRIAQKNNIAYATTECTFQGECKGTCPKCEAELRYLAEELERLKASGKRVAVAGIATALVATSAAGCTPEPVDELEQVKPGGGQEVIEIDGLIPAEPAETPEEIPEVEGEAAEPIEYEELDGDVAYPVEPEEEVFGEVIDPKYKEPEEEPVAGIIAAPDPEEDGESDE